MMTHGDRADPDEKTCALDDGVAKRRMIQSHHSSFNVG